MSTNRLSWFAAVLLCTACQGTFFDEGAGGITPPPGAEACPTDPDAYIGGDPGLYECPEFWVCETLSDGATKRCVNPGPDQPAGGGEWSCYDEAGVTVCRGSDFPEGGGGAGWRCEDVGDLVECRRESDYPDGDGPWDCWFEVPYRICESGGGGDYPGGDTPGGDRPGGGGPGHPSGGGDICFWPVDDPTAGAPVVRATYAFETRGGRDVVHVALIFDEGFVDNTWGANSSDGYRGGDNGHRFRDLVASDHAEVGFTDAGGREVLRAKFDYISNAPEMGSGFDALGVHGGDGSMLSGDVGAVVDATSSLDRNFNELGCVDTESSPTAAECPGWELRVIYEMWLDRSAFAGGFGSPVLEFVHASPSRTTDTIYVEPRECP